MYSLTILEARISKLRCQQGSIPSRVSRGESFRAPSSAWWLQVFLGLWQPHSDICLHLHVAFSVCLGPNLLLLFLVKIPVTGFRAHPKRFHLKILNWSYLHRLLFPNKFTFCSSGWILTGVDIIQPPTPRTGGNVLCKLWFTEPQRKGRFVFKPDRKQAWLPLSQSPSLRLPAALMLIEIWEPSGYTLESWRQRPCILRIQTLCSSSNPPLCRELYIEC